MNMLHIKIDGNPYCSPYPVFFGESTSEISDFRSEIDPLYQKNDSGYQISKLQIPCLPEETFTRKGIKPLPSSLIQTTFHKFYAESSWIKAQDLPALITVNQLHDLFCLYGEPILGNFKKESYQRHVFLKFRDSMTADRSLLSSGTLFGDKLLFIKKWVEPCSIQRKKKLIDAKSIFNSEVERLDNYDDKLYEKSNRYFPELLEKNWQHQRNLLERYATLTVESRLKGLKPNSLLIPIYNDGVFNKKTYDFQPIKPNKSTNTKESSSDLGIKQTTLAEWNLL